MKDLNNENIVNTSGNSKVYYESHILKSFFVITILSFHSFSQFFQLLINLNIVGLSNDLLNGSST